MSNGWSMSALPPKADIAERNLHVRFVPKADIALWGLIALRCVQFFDERE
jgi:hypothetical protein